jgi:hypothetical protein
MRRAPPVTRATGLLPAGGVLGHAFLQCRGDERRIHQCIDAAGGPHPRGHRGRRWLAALRPLHGHGLVRAGPGLLRARQPAVRRCCRVGQRLRHRAGTVAAVRPRAGGAAGAGAAGHRHGRGVGIRRRVGRAGGAAAGDALGERRGLPHRRPLGHAARAPGRAAGALWRPRALARCAARRFDGVVVGNEVLDAMPVQLLHFDGRELVGTRRDGARRRLRLGRPPDRAAPAGRRQPSCPAR